MYDTYLFLVCKKYLFFPSTFEILHTHVYLYRMLTFMKCKMKVVNILQLAVIFFFHIYVHLNITCLKIILVFARAYEVLHNIYKYCFFFSFLLIACEIVHSCVSIRNVYALNIHTVNN